MKQLNVAMGCRVVLYIGSNQKYIQEYSKYDTKIQLPRSCSYSQTLKNNDFYSTKAQRMLETYTTITNQDKHEMFPEKLRPQKKTSTNNVTVVDVIPFKKKLSRTTITRS